MRRLVKISVLLLSATSLAIAACVADEPNGSSINVSDGSTGDGSSTGDSASNADGSGGCTSTQTACGSSCVVLDTDKKNCGACGHDCLGGDCGGGKCAAFAVTTGKGDAATAGVQAIASDPNGVYWAAPVISEPGAAPSSTSSLYHCAPTGDCSVPDIVDRQGEIDQLLTVTSQPSFLFYTDSTDDYALRVATAGADGGDRFSTCASGANPCGFHGLPGAYGIASEGTSLYIGGNNHLGGGQLDAVAFADGGVKSIASPAAQHAVVAMAFDPTDAQHTYVYVATATGIIEVFGTASSVNTSAAYVLATNELSLSQMVLAHGLVFFSNPSGGQIQTVNACVASSCTANQTPAIFATFAGSDALTADAKNVYWSAGGDILTCPLTGCPTPTTPTTLASSPARVRTITNDATAIYWGDDLGSIYRLAK